MNVRSVWLRSLSAILCLGGTICLAQDVEQKLELVLVDEATPQVARLAVDEAPADAEAPQSVLLRNVDVDAPAGGAFAFTAAGQLFAAAPGEVEPGKYWIGLLCVDPGEPLRTQLGLESGVGLLVEAVTDDSPAKKAGLQQHDVLVTAQLVSEKAEDAARKLTQVKELVDVVQAAETKPLHLVVVRKGQKQVIEVAPTERPKVNVYHQTTNAEGILGLINTETQPQGAAVRELTARIHEPHVGMRLAGPMFTVELKAPPLPEGMTMEFHQVVGQPEKVTVRKGQDMWGATEKELDTLPEDIRALVLQQMAVRRARHLPPGMPGMQAMHGMQGMAMSQPVMQPPASMRRSATQKDGDVTVWAGAGQRVTVAAAKAGLPDDVTVTIVRKGSEPAKITARKGEQTWDVTEKELDKLPEDLRKHVDSVLKGAVPKNSSMTGAYTVRGAPVTVSVPATSSSVLWSARRTQEQAVAQQKEAEAQRDEQLRRAKADLEQKLKHLQQIQEENEIHKQLKVLTEQVENLRKDLEKVTKK